MQQRLEARGIDASLAGEVATSALRDHDPVEEAVRFGRGRLGRMGSTLKHPARLRRVAAALARRGFDEEVIAASLERLGLRGE